MLVDSAPDVRVRLLGGVELQVDARDVPVTSRLQRAILAVLALNAGHVVSSARLIDALWGEQAPDTVTTALQVHVSGLRKVLGPASKAVVTRSPGYLLAIPADHVDVLALEDALRVARKGAPAAQWPSVTLDAVPLADLAGLPFVAAAAAHIEELRWASAEERSEAELAAGGHADLVPRLQDMVAAQPYREGLWRSLMVALYRCGRQSDALAAFRQVTKVLRDDLGLDPGPALVAVQRAVLAADPILLASPVASGREDPVDLSIPPRRGALIGRDHEVALVLAALAEHRLVTLTGPGGVGKSSLAHEVALQLTAAAPDTAGLLIDFSMVDSSPVEASRQMLTALSQRLSATAEEADRDAVASIARAIISRPLLVVLDSMEHLRQAVPDLERLLDAAPLLRVLTTSRRSIGSTRERVVPVGPLLPDAAAELFVLGSRAAPATVGVDDAVVVALCRRLEGLPLAIELAASRCRLMDPHDLLSVLDDRLTQLTGEGAARPTRQRTIQATLEWSVELLSPRARWVFAQLGATAGSLALRDVLAVVDEVAPSDGASPVHDTDSDLTMSDLTMSDLTMSDLDALVDASLVRVINRRYRMLDMVRAYASHLLTTSGRAHQVRQRHLGWAIDTCKAATEGKEGPDEDRALAELSEVLPDLQLAASGAFAAGAGEDGAGLLLRARRAWFLAGRSQELWDLLDRAGHADLTPVTAAEVQGLSAVIGKILGLTGLDALDRAARELRPYPSAALMLVNVLCHQAALLAESGSAQAKEVAAEAVTAARTSGSAGDVSMALDLSAYVARALGDRQLAVELARNAVAEAGAHGAQRALALAGYCASLAEAGDPATALEPGLEAVARARASGQAVTQAEVVTVVAGALGDRHATVLAQDLAVAVAVCVAYGNKQSATEAAYQLARFAAPTQPGLAAVLAAGADQFAPSPAAGPDRADLIDVLGETAYAQARAKGALLREDDIVRLAQVVADGLTPDRVVSERPFADGWRAVDEGVAK